MAIADKLTTIAGIKTDIRTAINNKGGSLTSGSPFSAYSAAISSLPSGGGYPPDWSEIGYTGAPQTVLDAFSHAKTIHDNWDPTVTMLNSTFRDDTNLVYMPMVDTSAVTWMPFMFTGCKNLTVVPAFDTSKVTNMKYMFNGCSSLTSVPAFNTSACTNMSNMFCGCSSLTTVPAFNTSACTDMNSMFSGCTSITSIPLLNTSSVTNMEKMFYKCSSLTTVPAFNTSACNNMSKMFSDCTSLSTVPAFDTSSVTSMNDMFNGCSGLTSIPALNSSGVTNIIQMFYNCKSLEKITSLDMSKCTSFGGMFGYGDMSKLRFMLLKGLGTPSGVTSYGEFNSPTNWGVDSTDIPDARQSLVDSLLTYSFDRATAGYATCTIKLSNSSYNQLTAQEIADIQAKGYSITK